MIIFLLSTSAFTFTREVLFLIGCTDIFQRSRWVLFFYSKSTVSLNTNSFHNIYKYFTFIYSMDECIICFEETTEFVTFPCDHKVCVVCYPQLTRCPLCNREIIPTSTYTPPHTSYITRHSSIQMVCYFVILFSVLFFLFRLSSVPFFQYQH